MKKVTKRMSRSCLLICTAMILLAIVLAIGLQGSAMFSYAKITLNPDTSNPQYFQRYATREETLAAGNAINERIAEEGIALFKNEISPDGTRVLPIAGDSKISLFGSCSTNLRQAGNGSGSGQSNEGEKESTVTIFSKAGFSVNRKLYSMYEEKNSLEEIDIGNYTDDIVASYKSYNDAAILFVSRADGGENTDAKLGDGTTPHSQELRKNELALFEHIKNAKDADGGFVFEKIVVCINTSDPFEIASYQDDPRVQGVIWMGFLGSTGLNALPKILNGSVNPSAHTVDAWPANLRQDPAWFNFGRNEHVGGSNVITGTMPNGKEISTIDAADGQPIRPAFRALFYKEGIYMGYRWYETASKVEGYYDATPEKQDPLHSDDPYYNRMNGVLYPFGYGLSYTTFEWTAGEPTLAAGELNADAAGTDVVIPVTVKNIGDYAGKDVVQLYVRAPYGETAPIEKPDVTFINSAKTKLLQPSEEQTVEIRFNIRDLASFDWNDINNNDFKGYELEQGSYDMLLRTDSHTDKNEEFKISYTVGVGGIQYNEEGDSPLNYNRSHGVNAKAVFSQNNEWNTSGMGAIDAEGTPLAKENADYISRGDWKLPTAATADQLAWSEKAIFKLLNLTYTSAAGTNGDKSTDPWYKTAEDIPGYGKSRDQLQPGDWKQASEEDVAARKNKKTELQLKDMIGVPFDDVKWVNFMNQLTFDEMAALIQDNWYKSPGLDAIGKPATEEKDGPGQITTTNGRGTFWCCETTIAATYNTQLAYEMGDHMGQECLLLGISGWYGPGMNTHRLAFNGRNFEYYSSDGRQGGWIGAAVIKGVTDNGVHVYAKHYVCNDQETDRLSGGGPSVIINEQALREIYLKPFEIATKYGNMNGIMTGHLKLGLIGTESNYYSSKYFLYDECGFEGNTTTDAIIGAYSDHVVGCAQHVTGDRLARLYITPLAWNYTAASSDAALSGTKVEGRYDAATNKLMVAEVYVDQEKWRFKGNHDEWEDNTGFITDITNSGQWNVESPTQWHSVRMTAQHMLYLVANSASMKTGNGDQLGVVVTVHYEDRTEVVPCKIGAFMEEPEKPEFDVSSERFIGWYTDVECTRPANFPMTVIKATHLYPLITAITSCVQSYDLNYNGAPAPVTQFFDTGSSITLSAFDPVRDGYTFGGWYLEPTCVNKVNPNDPNSLVIESDRTFYAKWTAINKCTVSFNYNYESAPAKKTITVEAGETIMPPVIAPERAGYVFKGWYEDESCEYEADFTKAVNYDVSYYARWEALAEQSGVTNGCGSAVSLNVTAVIFAAAIAVLGIVMLIAKIKKEK